MSEVRPVAIPTPGNSYHQYDNIVMRNVTRHRLFGVFVVHPRVVLHLFRNPKRHGTFHFGNHNNALKVVRSMFSSRTVVPQGPEHKKKYTTWSHQMKIDDEVTLAGTTCWKLRGHTKELELSKSRWAEPGNKIGRDALRICADNLGGNSMTFCDTRNVCVLGCDHHRMVY
jgi:hypothetical protein